ncbi:MAG TPA: sulfatase-like hydrolase/transferase, partial [Amaricoccus sp.]|nr:sulfatase-like hydrolase/transferase [Amaricoccus sp.]
MRLLLASTISTAAVTVAMTAAMPRAVRAGTGRPNVILIVCDDLNCSISPYAPEQRVHSPNFERLRDMGAMFENAFAVVPACAPSRASMLLGLMPTTSGLFTNGQNWQDATPAGAESLFGHLRKQGWDTFGTGKLFHGAGWDLRQSDWTGYWMPERYYERLEEREPAIAASASEGFDFGPSEEAAMPDVECTDRVIDRIASGGLDAGGVVVALGLARPHLPLRVGQAWFDLYPGEVERPPGYWPGARTHEENLPDQADLGRTGRRKADRIGERLTEHGELDDFLRAYYASVSFVDGEIGRVLDAVTERDLWANTYVIVTSDHGFMLGEKRQFSKFVLREAAIKVPLFVAGGEIVPQRVADPVSLIDIFPTVCGLAGVAAPDECEGQDLAPTMRGAGPPARGHSISCYGGRQRNDAEGTETFRLHATIRTAKWRLIDYGPAR